MALDLFRQEIKNPVGILTDPNPSDLPPASWSGGRNIRFRNGKVQKAQGHDRVFGLFPTGTGEVIHTMPFLVNATPYWFVNFSNKIYRTTGTSWVDMTRTSGDYTASPDYRWNGGFLNQVAVLNNGRDLPQSLKTNDNKFVDLPNWPATHRCKIMRPFKNYLVALNITADSVNQPTVVKWSSPADPGEVPATWDPADATNDAGENPLADTPGAIVDGKKLRDQFIIYKEDSVYAMRYIGGVFVFAFQQLYDDVGMLAPNCAAEFDGKHFVVGQGDVYVHNGVQKKSVIDGQNKFYLFNAIRSGSIEQVFVVPDYANSEMWVCFQSTAEAQAGNYSDRAAIWNWQDNTWTFRDLPQTVYATHGVVDPQEPDNWDVDSAAWNTDTTVWGYATYNPAMNKILMLSQANRAAYVVGETSLFDTATFQSRLERTDLYGDDDLLMKRVNSITPHIRGTGTCQIYVGASDILDSPVEWYGPFNYEIGQDYKIDCRVLGRYIGVRFEFDSSGTWELNGYTLEFTPPGGKR